MGQIVLDLSGQKGLADNFAGNADIITTSARVRTNVKDGEMAQGLYNPYLRVGYLAPISTDKTTVTADVAVTRCLTSQVYNYTNNLVFMGSTAGQLYKLDSLVDVSLTQLDTLASASTIKNLFDLEMYELNGVRKLYAVYNKTMPISASDSNIGNIQCDANPQKSVTVTTRQRPSGSTAPVLSSWKDVAGSGSTTLGASLSGLSGSNAVIIVIAISKSSFGVSSATLNGAAMTSVSYSAVGSWNVQTYKYYNPGTTSGSVSLTFTGAPIEIAMESFWMDGCNTTSGPSFDRTASNSAGLMGPGPAVTTDNQLLVQYTLTDGANIAALSSQTLVDSGTNNIVNPLPYTLYKFDATRPYLQLARYGEDGSLETQNVIDVSTPQPNGAFVQQMNTNWAFMRKADNGYAYIFADNAIHKFDGSIIGGAKGVLTKNVLLFPSYFRITDAVDFRSRLYVAVHQYPVDTNLNNTDNFVGQCGVFVWNRISTQLSGTDFIELPGVREIKKIYVSPDQTLKLITIGNNGLTELRSYGYDRDSGGVVLKTFKLLGVGAYPQYPDGLSVVGDKVMWLANDANIYGEKTGAVTQLFRFKTPGTTTATQAANIASGMLFYGSGSETGSTGFRENKQGMIASYFDSTQQTYKIYPFDTKNGSNSSMIPDIGSVYTGVQYIPMASNVRNVRIYNNPITGTGTSVVATIKMFFNQSTVATVPSGMTKSVSKDEAHRGYVDFKINQAYLNAIQLCFEWNVAEPLGGDTYLPSVAVITYDETKIQSPDGD